MKPHRKDTDRQNLDAPPALADGGQASESIGPLRPLLQRTAHPYGGELSVHGAFIVDAHDKAIFTVSNREHGRRYQVRRAASCLLLPAAGDKVLVSGDVAGGLYIIAVLEQRDCARTTLQVDGALTVSADELSLKGNRTLSMETTALTSTAMTSRYAGNTKESYYRLVSDTVGESVRYVTGTDTVKAVNLDYAADFIARLSGKSTFINGETLLKTDGKQILVG